MNRRPMTVAITLISVALLFLYVNDSDKQRDGGIVVSWEDAVVILNSGDVEEVFQLHSLDVTLVLKNGTMIYTKEPRIDAIFDEMEKCGKVCSDSIKSVATE